MAHFLKKKEKKASLNGHGSIGDLSELLLVEDALKENR